MTQIDKNGAKKWLKNDKDDEISQFTFLGFIMPKNQKNQLEREFQLSAKYDW